MSFDALEMSFSLFDLTNIMTFVSHRDAGADWRLALTPVRSVRLKGFTAIDVGDSIKQDGVVHAS